MEELGNRVTDARRRILALVSVARWVWVVNTLIGLTSFVCHRYELAAVAGYTSAMSFFVAVYARRAARQLRNVERIITSS